MRRKSRMTKSRMLSNTRLMARPTPRKKSTTGCRKLMIPSAMRLKRLRNHRPMPTKNCPMARKKPTTVLIADEMAFGRVSVNQR